MKSTRPPSDPGLVGTDFDCAVLTEVRRLNAPHYQPRHFRLQADPEFGPNKRRAELEAQMPTYRPSIHPLRGIRPGA